MIGFDISIDGQKVCTAGAGAVGVVSVIASCVRRAAQDAASGQAIPDQFEEEVKLDVGGFAREADGSAVNVKWLDQPLIVGQTITLTVVDGAEADPPKTHRRDNPAVVERRKREYYERLKKEYGE